MAAITLREYVREIEKQVDGGRNEEAIAHSRHVLESFPKYVNVYRLLGKAYLESQRYGDAGDIFQRVLSAAPEDFVSHVGMSIIREDEGNLDEAIWHMERAFDVQPSNSAIQEELRRLYGRRDNIEPPKIRLTRGALARMYYKGELYPQAIAEVRAALNEAPDRLDLQALLAEIYAKAGQRAEAVEMAGQVLHTLPFCLAANQIMVDMLIGTEKESEIQTYFQRLSQLDPYAAEVTAAAPRAENVPDQAIRLNKLDYKAREAIEGGPGQPLWAATLGIEVTEMATGREESLPEWLAAGPESIAGDSELAEDAQVPAFASDEAQDLTEAQIEETFAPSDEEQIPDWMKDLGWGLASEESRQAEAALQFEEESDEPAIEGELAAAEIPDWLQAMAPADAQTEAKEGDEDVSPWLDQLFSAEPEVAESGTGVERPLMEGEAETPDWLEAGLVLGAAAVGAAALGREEEALEGTEKPEGEEMSEAAGESVEEAIPDWLAEISPEGELAAEEAGEEIPDWLSASLAPAVILAQTEEELTEQVSEESVLAEAIQDEATPAEEAAELVEELPSWLFESEATPGAEAAAAATAEEAEELPEWLFESEVEPSAEVSTEEAVEEAEELPEWLFESEAETDVEAAPEEAAEEAEELPEWLLEGAALEQAEEGAEESAEEAEGVPDWLKAAGAVTGAAAVFKASEWLSDEETPEEEAAVEAVDLEAEMEPVEALLDEELPEWLRPIEEGTEPEAEEPILDELAVLAAAGIAPPMEEWQAETETVEVGDVQPSPVELVAETAELDEAFAWLDSLLTPVEEAAEAVEEPGVDETKATAPPETPGAEIPLDEDAAFAWLESLAVRQGAQEALLLKPEERLETPPEWVQRAAAEGGEDIQTEAEEMQAEMAAMAEGTPPDWLKATMVAGAAGAVLDKITEEKGAREEAVEEPAEPALPEVAEEAVEPVALTTPEPTAEEPPELPDWLAAPGEETREETLEWTPPPLSRRKYDLNKITLVEMERLPGIGFIMAQKVIDYRNTHGLFKQIDDLLNVPDFNVPMLEGVRDNLYLEVPVEPVPAAARTPTQPRPGTGPLVLATGAGLPNEVVKAREHLSEGYLEEALGIYDKLIHSKKHLTWVIEDLSEATNQYPNELYIWQSLGDAYVRSDLASQALQSYIRAEKLLLV